MSEHMTCICELVKVPGVDGVILEDSTFPSEFQGPVVPVGILAADGGKVVILSGSKPLGRQYFHDEGGPEASHSGG